MTVEVIALGSADLLHHAFNGIAAMNNAGTFDSLIKIGAVIGLLLAGLKSLISNRFEFMPVLVASVLNLAMFGPTTTVNIVDPYAGLPSLNCKVDVTTGASSCGLGGASAPGSVRTVDNVPWGVVAPYMIASYVGTSFSDTMDSAFGFPDMYQAGDSSINGISILSRLHKFGGGNSANMGLLKQQIQEYYKDCVEWELDLGVKKTAVIDKATDLMTALTSTNQALATKNYLDTSSESKTCGDMSVMIQAKLAATDVQDEFKSALAAQNIGTDEALTMALDAMLGTASVDSMALMKNAFLANVTKCAANGNNTQDCVALTQATLQRDAKWVGEQSLFLDVMRPMMTFIELFSIAAIPIFAFLIATGIAIQLAAKFLQLIAWISLWPITMGIANVFIYWAAQNNIVTAFRDPTLSTVDMSSALSISGMSLLTDVTSKWVATGSMMAAATPVLTFFLVTGSAQAFSAVASRMSGSQHLNEKQMRPDLMQPAPYQSNTPGRTFDPVYGGKHTGANLESVQVGQMANSSLQQAKSNIDTGQQMQSKILSKNEAKVAGQTITADEAKSVSQDMSNSKIKSVQEASANVKAIGRDYSQDSQWGDKMTAKIGMMAAAGVSLPVFQAAMKAELDKSKFSDESQKTSAYTRLTDTFSKLSSTTSSSEMRNGIGSLNRLTKAATSSFSQTDQAAFNSAGAQIAQATEQQTAAQGLLNTFGSGSTLDTLNVAKGMSDSGVTPDSIKRMVNDKNMNSEFMKNFKVFKGKGLDEKTATLAAGFATMFNAGLKGDADAMQKAIDFVTPSTTAPVAANGVQPFNQSEHASRMGEAGNVGSEVNKQTGNVESALASKSPDTPTGPVAQNVTTAHKNGSGVPISTMADDGSKESQPAASTTGPTTTKPATAKPAGSSPKRPNLKPVEFQGGGSQPKGGTVEPIVKGKPQPKNATELTQGLAFDKDAPSALGNMVLNNVETGMDAAAQGVAAVTGASPEASRKMVNAAAAVSGLRAAGRVGMTQGALHTSSRNLSRRNAAVSKATANLKANPADAKLQKELQDAQKAHKEAAAFDKFSRGETEKSLKDKGLGVGMAVGATEILSKDAQSPDQPTKLTLIDKTEKSANSGKPAEFKP